jgi:allantoate deiminase
MTVTLGERIYGRIGELARISDSLDGLTRLYLSPAHKQAADLVAQWMREAGLSVRIDAVGSVIGRREGLTPQAPALLIGSHIDTVSNAGWFDGCLGVVTAISVASELAKRNAQYPFAIEVIAFGDEEGVRFASALGGSRAIAGTFDPAILDERDEQGISRREALAAFGCNPGAIAAEARRPATALGYVEVHIEQGPVLEAEELPIGVVTAISGATRGFVEVHGEAGHAGTVPMAGRRDALAAAAEMILAVEARAKGEADLVATVGRLAQTNAATNTIAGNVRFSLDIRAPEDQRRETAIADIKTAIARIAAQRGVRTEVSLTYEAPATPCDTHLMQLLADTIEGAGIRVRRLPSGAGHDAMAFRGILPLAMLFVRCKGGISHHPAEHASAADIDAAALVLMSFIKSYASEFKQTI